MSESVMPSPAQRTEVRVDLGEIRTVDSSGPLLYTGALGACVAVLILDPDAKVGGLLPFLLPDSSFDLERSGSQPGLFADTGIEILLDRVLSRGAKLPRLQTYLVGGADAIMRGDLDTGALGALNLKIARDILTNAQLSITGERTGGHVSHSVVLDLYKVRVRVVDSCNREDLL